MIVTDTTATMILVELSFPTREIEVDFDVGVFDVAVDAVIGLLKI